MTPTQTLRHEHEIILHVLDAAQREVETIEATGTLHADNIEKMVDFFRNFADRCHHMKEEQQLFVRLGERGMPTHTGPVAVMLSEHETGRNFVRTIVAALPKARANDSDAIQLIGASLAGYSNHLRSHIAKENNILFPMADRVLTAADQTELAAAFDRVEAEEIGEGVHEKYHQLAHELSANAA
jgi:hemerythrin-like domain-containing protein